MCEAPVLLIVFNRPEITKRLFEVIQYVKPSKLYIAADGPRVSKVEDIQLCEQVISIFDYINWPCQVNKLFRSKNLGCDIAVTDAINWFFSHEEQGIILEDDCIPSHSFFHFCHTLLNRFKNNNEIAIISGTTYFDSRISTRYNYFISNFMYTWGFATWKDRWMEVDFNKKINLENAKMKLFDVYKNEEYVTNVYNNIAASNALEVGNWDASFYMHNIFANKKGIIPSVNLISNIGVTGTHSTNSNSKLFNTKLHEQVFHGNFFENYSKLSNKDQNRIIKSVNNKMFPLTLKDKLYLLKMKIINFINKK